MASRVTPMDIENQVFNRKMRGWDSEEVRLYLRSVAEEVERLNLENGEMREEIGRLRLESEAFRTREKTLQETLVAAQTMGEELKRRAREEGDLVIKEAQLRAEAITHEAREEMARLNAEILRSQIERENLECQLRGLLDQHLTLLDMRSHVRGKADNLHVLPRKKTGSEAG